MLDKAVDSLAYDDDGKVCGVTSGGETAKAGIVLCDPSYAEDKCKSGMDKMFDNSFGPNLIMDAFSHSQPPTLPTLHPSYFSYPLHLS